MKAGSVVEIIERGWLVVLECHEFWYLLHVGGRNENTSFSVGHFAKQRLHLVLEIEFKHFVKLINHNGLYADT